MEDIRPELQQYFIERNYDGRPFDRDTRSLDLRAGQGHHGEQAFGTERDVNEPATSTSCTRPRRSTRPTSRRAS